MRQIEIGVVLTSALLMLPGLIGCASLQQSGQEIAALRDVQVDVAGTRNEVLAGIDVSRLRDGGSLRAQDALRLAAAIRERRLPLSFVLDLDAKNSGSSQTTARILSIDWRLLVSDREAVSGRLGEQPGIGPGRSIRIPISMDLELVQLFGDDLEELLKVARSVAGYGDTDIEAFLMVTPTVDTALGPVRYPGEMRVRLH